VSMVVLIKPTDVAILAPGKGGDAHVNRPLVPQTLMRQAEIKQTGEI